MARADEPPRMTEPQAVDCVFVEGVSVEVRDDVIRLVGWITLETVEDGKPPERRIVMRIALTMGLARSLFAQIRRAVQRGRH